MKDGTMLVTLVKRALPVRTVGIVTLATFLVLAAGLSGAGAPTTIVAIAAAFAALIPGVALVSLGLALRVTFRGTGSCRCAGMLGLGVLVGAGTAATIPMLATMERPTVGLLGMLVAAVLSMLGVLQIPLVAASAAARLRLVLDGVSVGVLLALVGWLLMPGTAAAHRSAYLAAVVAVTCTAITVRAVIRLARTESRTAMLRCGLGVALALGGLALLVAITHREPPQGVLLVATLLVVAGPQIAWAGVRRFEFAPPPPAAESWSEPPDSGLRALVASVGDVTMVLSEDLVIRWQSPAAHQAGLASRGVVGRRFTDLVHPGDLEEVGDRLRSVVDGSVPASLLIEARLLDHTGGWRETESTVSDLRQVPEVSALVVQVRDVGKRRHLQRMVRLLESTDRSTGLPNRDELLRAVTARRAGSSRRGTLIVVALHDAIGPDPTGAAGLTGRAAEEAVLQEAAGRVRAHAGADDVAARLGGDQFAVVSSAGPIEAYALGVRLVFALTMPYRRPDGEVRLQVSVGLVGLSSGDGAEQVLRRAELALRRAGQRGRDQVEWYDESLEEQLVRRLDLERHLPGAAGRGELNLVYQPVVALESRAPVGVEALLRWRHPVLGRVLPGELIPVADQLRVSTEIGEWVLHTACSRVAGWRQSGHDLWLALNVSSRQLADPGFVPGLAAALSVHQSPPERLTVELSVTEAGKDLVSAAAQLGKVRNLGVRTALDDVGSGNTDLAWLRRLPLDVVKLATPPVEHRADGLVAAVLNLTDRLGLTVVAEGLETEAQRELVRRAGCRFGQGFLISAPRRAERFETYLDLASSGAAARGANDR